MAFELKNVVPWGRTLKEYKDMFALNDSDLNQNIISFGDGPASFNAEMTRLGKNATSIDPVYRFKKAEIKQRIDETCELIIEQARNNCDNFIWTSIKSVDELKQTRLSAMSHFLADFETGKKAGRYLAHELPQKLNFEDQKFDLGLSSHFLILYSQLRLNFHIQSINEMLRLCKEIRIFPLVNLNSKKSEVLNGIIEHFNSNFKVEIKKVNYEFQKGANEVLVIINK